MSPRKKKTYLAIIALGGVGVLVDRFILTAPVSQPTEAVAATPTHSAEPTGKGTQSGSFALRSIPELPFPRGLEAYHAGEEFRDLFAPPGSQWRGRPGDGRTDNAEGSRRLTTASSFPQRHKLTGVVLLERLGIAVVDGSWLRIGESLDGCLLTEIGNNSARFRCSDGETSLEVIESANPSPR